MAENPASNVYVGERYILNPMGEWDSTLAYEGLSMVSYQTNTYVSKFPVPAGTVPTNTKYWMLMPTGSVDISVVLAQLNQLTSDMTEVKSDVAANTSSIQTNTADIIKNTDDITKNTSNIAKNTGDISSLDTRVTTLENSTPSGPPTGASYVPAGGTAGQVLAKTSAADAATQWTSISQPTGSESYVPAPGNPGQWLMTTLDKQIKWADLPANHGIPNGGTTGQVLAKASNDDYVVQWINQSGGTATNGLPTGGTSGQVLVKYSSENYDTTWSSSLTTPWQNHTGVLIGYFQTYLIYEMWISCSVSIVGSSTTYNGSLTQSDLHLPFGTNGVVNIMKCEMMACGLRSGSSSGPVFMSVPNVYFRPNGDNFALDYSFQPPTNSTFSEVIIYLVYSVE